MIVDFMTNVDARALRAAINNFNDRLVVCGNGASHMTLGELAEHREAITAAFSRVLDSSSLRDVWGKPSRTVEVHRGQK